MLVTYGSHVVAAGASSDPYGQRYKGIWICLELLKRALAGNYVNFGVFELYGDPALKVRLSADLPITEGTNLYMSTLSAFTLPQAQAFSEHKESEKRQCGPTMRCQMGRPVIRHADKLMFSSGLRCTNVKFML